MPHALIIGSGSWIPPNKVTNEMLSRIMDTSDEWIIWISVILGFGLLGFDYLYESRHKKDNSEDEPKPPSTTEQKLA